MMGMEPNPYKAPQEPAWQKPAERKTNRRLLAWDALNVVLWMIALATLAALLMPAVQ